MAIATDVLAPKIVAPEPIHDFGERENTETVEHAFLIRNEGSLSLEIRRVRAGCGCTAATPAENVIPPGGETHIQARLNLRGRRNQQIQSIRVESNDPRTPMLVLQMRGTAIEGLQAQPASLFYGRVEPGSDRTRLLEVTSGRGPFQVLNVRSEHEGILIGRRDPEPGDEGRRHRLEITLDDSLPVGAFNTRLWVQTDIPGAAELPIPLSAVIVPPRP